MRMGRRLAAVMLAGGCVAWSLPPGPVSAAEAPVLPTPNRALLDRGGGREFYMHIVRKFEGRTTHPWEGGQYGFVRNPKVTDAGLVYSRFHEGVDIRPVRRDAAGEPLDEVRAILSGRVVYVSAPGSGSGYGNYVVIEHDWDGAPYYSLSAHLARAEVNVGQRVARGEVIGTMGHTGPGLDRERAHLHFEINLLLNSDFEAWHAQWFPNDVNRHDLYNGLNLAGLDVAALYLTLRNEPDVGPADIIRRKTPFWRARLPRKPEIMERYPWLVSGSGGRSWEVTFDASGLPLNVKPSEEPCDAPTVVWAKPTRVAYSYLTRGRLRGSGGKAELTSSGVHYLDLIAR